MGRDKGEACDIYKDEKDMLTYFSRVVLFHITGFYQWLVNSKIRVYWWLIKFSHYVPWKPHIEDYIRKNMTNIQDIRGLAAKAVGKNKNPKDSKDKNKSLTQKEGRAAWNKANRCNAMHERPNPAPAGEGELVKLKRAQGGCLGTKSRWKTW